MSKETCEKYGWKFGGYLNLYLELGTNFVSKIDYMGKREEIESQKQSNNYNTICLVSTSLWENLKEGNRKLMAKRFINEPLKTLESVNLSFMDKFKGSKQQKLLQILQTPKFEEFTSKILQGGVVVDDGICHISLFGKKLNFRTTFLAHDKSSVAKIDCRTKINFSSSFRTAEKTMRDTIISLQSLRLCVNKELFGVSKIIDSICSAMETTLLAIQHNLCLDTEKYFLVEGNSGCGKSAFCKSLIKHSGIPCLLLDCLSVFHKYEGDSETFLATKMEEARHLAPISVLVVEEVDVLLSSKDKGSEKSGSKVQLLSK